MRKVREYVGETVGLAQVFTVQDLLACCMYERDVRCDVGSKTCDAREAH
jgi:hypothetical protein